MFISFLVMLGKLLQFEIDPKRRWQLRRALYFSGDNNAAVYHRSGFTHNLANKADDKREQTDGETVRQTHQQCRADKERENNR